MLSLLLFVATFNHIHTYSYECPTAAQIAPCVCGLDVGLFGSEFGSEVFCNGTLADEVGVALANVASTNQRIDFITIQNVWLPNLPSNFLLGQNVNIINIRNCSTSSVDKDAFVSMAGRLNWLNLDYNALERVPSQALEKLLRVGRLELNNNRIEILHAEAFRGLDALIVLKLQGNGIKFIDNQAFQGIGSLFYELNLGGNKLTAVPYLPLRHLNHMSSLHLHSNQIDSILPEEFEAISGDQLRHLNLADNAIRHLPAGVFRSLESLDLSSNPIESIHPSSFVGTRGSLRILSLDYIGLEEVPSTVLGNLYTLETIGLAGNKIKEIRSYDFSGNRHLMSISLNNNSINHIDLNSFSTLRELWFLVLSSNQLTTVARESFGPVLDILHLLDLTDNPLHCDCNLSWYQDFMRGKEFKNNRRPIPVKCAAPEEHANVLLEVIPPDELVCRNSTPKPPLTNSQHHPSGDNIVFMTILEIISSYLLTVMLL